MELPVPKAIVTMAVGLSKEVAGASSIQDTALVLSSSHQAASSFAPLVTSSQHLDDDVVWEFDATHRLLELTTARGILVASVTSFGEKLQVSFSEALSLDVRLLLFLHLDSLSLSFCSVFLSGPYWLLFLV